MIRKLIRATYSAEAGLDAYARWNRILGRRGEYVLLACMPKTGSTFLKRALEDLTGFRGAVLTYAYERTEQELYLPRVIDAYRGGTVTQQHVRATEANLAILERFGIRPVVLVRNLFDVVVSIRDYLEAEGYEKFPSLYATDHLARLEEQEQYEFLIRFAMPWYFAFYASWYDASAASRVDALWLTYEELRSDWAAGIHRVLDHYGMRRSDRAIADALERARGAGSKAIRLNKGIVGRGAERLDEANQARIRRMATFYPWVDFSRVGLGPANGVGS